MSRYSRQICLPGMGISGQARLAAARVLVVGLGGLGSPAALYLAAAGAGTLGLADFDAVDESNLQRQILHDTAAARAGLGKLESALARLHGLNPDVRLVGHREGVTPENALELVRNYDVVVDGTDNFGTRYLLNDACALAGVPLVHGSVYQYEGQMAVFAPGRGGPCYRCLYPEMPGAGAVPNCAEAGVLGALCGVVGSWQALAALRLAAGVGEVRLDALTRYDARTDEWVTLRLARDPTCPVCGERRTIAGIETQRYAAPVCEAATRPEEETTNWANAEILVDVREPEETAAGVLPGARLIPLGEIEARAEAELPKGARVVVYCAKGMRSLQAVRWLRERGWGEARSLRGGYDGLAGGR